MAPDWLADTLTIGLHKSGWIWHLKCYLRVWHVEHSNISLAESDRVYVDVRTTL